MLMVWKYKEREKRMRRNRKTNVFIQCIQSIVIRRFIRLNERRQASTKLSLVPCTICPQRKMGQKEQKIVSNACILLCILLSHTVCEQTNSHLHVSKLIESMGPWDTWTWHLTRYLKRIIQTRHTTTWCSTQ